MPNFFKETTNEINEFKKEQDNTSPVIWSCGNQECENHCNYAFQIAKNLNIDLKSLISAVIEKYIVPTFSCRKNYGQTSHACSFGYISMFDLTQAYEEAYSDQKVVGIKHISCNKKTSCEICKTFDGKIYKWPEDKLLIPRLPLHPNCKCKQEEITDKKTLYELLDKLEKKGISVTVRIDESPGISGIRASGIDDMLDKLEKEHPSGGIKELIISNHGGLEGSFPMGNGDDLKYISQKQIDQLKKLLNPNAIIDIRMCYSAKDKTGNETAQKLANRIALRILSYEGPVSPYGTRPGFIKVDKDRLGNYFQHFFPDKKLKIFYPE